MIKKVQFLKKVKMKMKEMMFIIRISRMEYIVKIFGVIKCNL